MASSKTAGSNGSPMSQPKRIEDNPYDDSVPTLLRRVVATSADSTQRRGAIQFE